ncbi:helix-turn-helix transcriptional regulator [Enterococcus cecorum]|uniref:Helix-turn-helix transcriptional regulator n=1 Tax=Enterococcus cecorum TaxID=44008 RepID=A0A7X9NPA3_9ENTE|nr:helix-turn-helix transcriptional regulator [Enterococcus cecorum]NME50456.1 helix-turn-helix transcriptional regulator [Enterococcus cecorum]
MALKNKIKGYRTMLGLTQKEMAKRLNISSQSYYNKENGNVNFKDSEKMKIKEMLLPLFPNITLEDIFFD